jgi:hypothetical protein
MARVPFTGEVFGLLVQSKPFFSRPDLLEKKAGYKARALHTAFG